MSSRARFWVVTVAALVAVLVAARLGLWQLDRAAQKEAWVNNMTAQASQQELANSDWRVVNAQAANADAAVHRRMRLSGTWMAEHVVFLDNRQMNAKPGFYVLTPLRLTDGPVVVVQRGWVQRDFMQRDQVPDVATPSGVVSVYGRLATPPSQLYSWDNTQRTQIRQNLNWSDFSAEIGAPIGLLSLVELDEGDAPAGTPSVDGLLRQWPAVDAKLYTHYGYAAQWFALGLLVALLYFWFQWIAPRRVKQA
jgi:surfeit locus 1 family protein